MAEEDVYCTLLLNDNYLPGVKVLAHSLRDAGTTKRLAVMVTLETVSPDTVTELKKLYDYVIPVDPVYSRNPANLYLMNRPDLHSAFTKINLWKQTQFRRIVYVDADVVARRAADELFEIEAPFAAAPDIGWPDCFNSGVMVLKPDLETFTALSKAAEQGQSFDGADQGLLNQHFTDWHRISFNYNVTPSASYQYVPAYRHFGHQAAMVHFIGADKPWIRGARPGTGEPYDELSGQWWSVWNKHYGSASTTTGSTSKSGVHLPASNASATGAAADDGHIQIWPKPAGTQNKQGGATSDASPQPITTHYEYYKEHKHLPALVQTAHGAVPQFKYFQTGASTYVIQEYTAGGEPISTGHFLATRADWDPSRSAPPLGSAAEAGNLERRRYANEWDNPGAAAPAPQQWQPPLPAPIFPWEHRERTTTRVFAEDTPHMAALATPAASVQEETEDEFEDADEGSETAGEEEEEYEEASAYPESATGNFQNQWDVDPIMRSYIAGLPRPRTPGTPRGGPGVGLPKSRAAAPSQWLSNEDPADKWDPSARLEQLKRHPEALLASLRGSGRDTEHDETTQTDVVPTTHRGTQWKEGGAAGEGDEDAEGSEGPSELTLDTQSEMTWDADDADAASARSPPETNEWQVNEEEQYERAPGRGEIVKASRGIHGEGAAGEPIYI